MSIETIFVDSFGDAAPTSATMRVKSRHDPLTSFYARYDPEYKDMLVIYKPVINFTRYELVIVDPIDFDIIEQLKNSPTPSTEGTTSNIPDALPGSVVMTGDAIGSTISMAGNWHDLGQFPPAGTKAEARCTDGTWEQCFVIGMNSRGQCIIETDWDCELRKVVRAIDFRPFDAKRQKLIENTRELVATRSMNDAQKAQAIYELFTSQQ